MLAGTYDPQVLAWQDMRQHHAGSGDGARLVPERRRNSARKMRAAAYSTSKLVSLKTRARAGHHSETKHHDQHAGDNMKRLIGMAIFAMAMLAV